MTEPKPFRRDKAPHVQFGELHTDFILPICIPDPEMMVGEDLAVLVVTTVEGQRLGAPMEVSARTNLQLLMLIKTRSRLMSDCRNRMAFFRAGQ